MNIFGLKSLYANLYKTRYIYYLVKNIIQQENILSVIVFSIGVPVWIKEGNKGGLARLIPNVIKIFMNLHIYFDK